MSYCDKSIKTSRTWIARLVGLGTKGDSEKDFQIQF